MPLDFRPDLNIYTPDIAFGLGGATPTSEMGYRLVYTATTSGYGTALTSACLGTAMIRDTSGTPHLFAGVDNGIFEANGSGGWTDRSRGGGYSTGSNQWWFTAHGSEVVATNYADETQSATFGAAFANLSNAPKCRFMISQSRALLACNYRDSSGTAIPHGIAISARGSSSTWTAAPSNDATSALLTQSEGPILAGASMNDMAVIWKRRSMYTGRFVGGAEKWQFNLIHRHIGCLGQEAWCDTPIGIIFAAEQGVYVFDGSVPRPIDFGIRKTLRAVFDSAYNQAQDTFISHDAKNATVYIWYRTAVTTWWAYAYNYATDRWGLAYYNNKLGGSTWTGFQGAVRNSNYQDLTLLNGSSNSNYIGHLIFSAERKLTNLAGGAESGIYLSISSGRIRAPGSNTKSQTRLMRVMPIWGASGEPASVTQCDIYGYPRRMASSVSSSTIASLTEDKCFDVNRVADNFQVILTGADGVAIHIVGFEYDMVPDAGRR